jgi:hypothetical protein
VLNQGEGLDIVIYPNPASKKLVINAGNLNEGVTATFFSLTGDKIGEYNIEKNSEISLDISEWKKALYLLRIQYNNRSYVYKILVK